MTPAFPPARYWRPLLLVVAAHAAVLALSWRAPVVPGGAGREVLEVEVLAGVPVATTAAPRAAVVPARASARLSMPAPSPAPVLEHTVPLAATATAAVAAPALAPASAGGAPAPAATAAVITAGGVPAEPVLIPPRLGPDAAEPAYPSGSRWDREEGRVTLQLVVRADGRVASARVVRSSGFPRLDRAARETALRWRLQPARRGGEAVEGVLDKTLEFRLEN